jgi:hypothetical protein
MKKYQNWLYIGYDNSGINAQLRLGYELGNPAGNDFNRKLLTLKPIVSYAFTPMISAGLSFAYAKDFGAIAEGLAFERMTLEPQVKVTFNTNAYVSLVYGFQQIPRTDAMEQAHFINLRLVYSF